MAKANRKQSDSGNQAHSDNQADTGEQARSAKQSGERKETQGSKPTKGTGHARSGNQSRAAKQAQRTKQAQHDADVQRVLRRSMIGRALIWLGLYILSDLYFLQVYLGPDLNDYTVKGVTATAALVVVYGAQIYWRGTKEYLADGGSPRLFILDAIIALSPFLGAVITLPYPLGYTLSLGVALVAALFADRKFMYPHMN